MGYVSAAEFVRKFARFRDESHDSPVFITHHGRETHVLCPIDLWNRIGGGEPGENPKQRNESANFALADWIDDGIIACDENMRVVYANRNAHALTKSQPGTLIGPALIEALPCISGSLLEVQARQTLVHGHPNMADIPSPFVETPGCASRPSRSRTVWPSASTTSPRRWSATSRPTSRKP
ncbi:PAS domain-containing protein [Novosphingobium sp. MBES04]|uniref:PAS domain-containing protein n=1 Tax=Novosphingobium sp. MBES04 TaxID=1206458 RepID=UPI00072332B2|nr:PAS domain-containing protein [Novosphingobium sp. MBES04]GAM07178.1 hypothetical protein MBENS4_4174 [Novosphingobium sp. MBES04]